MSSFSHRTQHYRCYLSYPRVSCSTCKEIGACTQNHSLSIEWTTSTWRRQQRPRVNCKNMSAAPYDKCCFRVVTNDKRGHYQPLKNMWPWAPMNLSKVPHHHRSFYYHHSRFHKPVALVRQSESLDVTSRILTWYHSWRHLSTNSDEVPAFLRPIESKNQRTTGYCAWRKHGEIKRTPIERITDIFMPVPYFGRFTPNPNKRLQDHLVSGFRKNTCIFQLACKSKIPKKNEQK